MQEKPCVKEQSIMSLGMDGPSVNSFIIQAKNYRARAKSKQLIDVGRCPLH